MSTAHGYTGPEITFEDILEDPSDETLNMNYAKQQEKRGDVVTALAAVERLLFSDADDDSLRLYYVSLLLKADDIQAAKRELKALERRELSGNDQSKNERYRREAGMNDVKNSSGGSKLRGMIALGARYDDSAGDALADGSAALTTSSSDMAVFAQGALQLKMPFEDGSGSVLRAGVNGQTLRHETFSAVDYDAFNANLGLSGGSKALTWHLHGELQRVYVDNQEYLSQAGVKARLGTTVSPGTKLIATAAYYDQDFDDLRSTFGEDGRSGEKLIGSVGIRHKLSESTAAGVTIGYTDKSATTDVYAYDGIFGSAELRHGFESGMYFRGMASYQDLNYKGGLGRNDDRLSGSVTFGAPFSSIAGFIGESSASAMENVNLEGTVRYTERNSNFTAVDFNNLGAEVRLVWNF